jgi:phosphopantothenoylcysteine synthetase/decarboxylase
MLVGPEEGWQACRAVGPGHMSEPETLFTEVQETLVANPPRPRR